MSTERTAYSAYAIIDGKRVEVKSAKSYSDAIKQLEALIAKAKEAKR